MFTSAVQSSRTNLKVLIVDDDPMIGEFIALQIEVLGCELTVVEDAREALDFLGAERIDLLITDWQMPGMDGMQLVTEARRSAQPDSHLHIAMMTARGENDVIRKAMEAGVDTFLYKPIQPVELELVVETAARNRLLHRRLMRRNGLLLAAHRRAQEALDRVHADLEAATALHERLLPNFDRIGVLELSHFYRPAAILGGDSIGVSPLREEGLLFFLIDVCGHGVPAALDSFHLHHRIKGLRPTKPEDLTKALVSLNREICGRDDDSYATMTCGLIFPQTREGWLACAGHPPPLLMLDGVVHPLDGGRAMPVGWFEQTVFEPQRFAFPPGARLLLYSDGVTDAVDTEGEHYGLDKLEQEMEDSAGVPLGEMVCLLKQSLESLNATQRFDDDISLLAIEHSRLEVTGQ